MKSRFILLALFFLVTASMSDVCAEKKEKLEPFSSIVICGAFDVGVQPSKDSSYSAQFLGDSTQFPSMEAVVVNGVLYVQNSADIITQNGVSMIISVPDNALKSLETKNCVGSVSVMPGLNAETFSIIASGTGDLSAVVDIRKDLQLNVKDQNVGNVEVSGTSGGLILTVKGTGDVSIFGLSGDAKVDLEGTGGTFIGGGPTTVISGSSSSMNPLEFTGKECNIPGGFFGPACERVAARTPPAVTLPDGKGMIQSGPSTCIKKPYF